MEQLLQEQVPREREHDLEHAGGGVYAVKDALMLLIPLVLFYKLAWFYFKEGLFPHRDIFASPMGFGESAHAIHLHTAGRVFSANMALFACIFELVIVEIAGLMHSDTRSLAWRLCLGASTFNLHAVTPALIVFTTLAQTGIARGASIAVTGVLMLVGVLGLWWVDESIRQSTQTEWQEIDQHFLCLSASLARIGVFGVMLVAVTSGFGAVNFPFTTLSSAFHMSPAVVAAKEQHLHGTLVQLGLRKRDLITLRQQGPANGGRSRRFGLGSNGGGQGGLSEQSLQLQVEALEAVAQQVFAEIRTARQRRPGGPMSTLAGVVMLVFCIVKLGLAARSLLVQGGPSNGSESPGRDPVTRWMGFFGVDGVWITQLVSFIFISVLVFNTARGFVQTSMQLSRASTLTLGASVSPSLLALLLVELMGSSLTASVLLLRINLPHRFRVAITGALGNIRFTFYHRWFDSIFLLSGAISALVLFTQQAQQRHNTSISSSIDDGSVDGGAAVARGDRLSAARSSRHDHVH